MSSYAGVSQNSFEDFSEDTSHLSERITFEVRDHIFVGKLFLALSFVALSLFLYHLHNVTANIAAIFILGAMYAHAVELQHQCLHFTAFRNRFFNRFFGKILGIPMMVSFTHYQVLHFRHHKNVGTSEDTEFFEKEPGSKISAKYIVKHLFDVKRIGKAFMSILRSLYRAD